VSTPTGSLVHVGSKCMRTGGFHLGPGMSSAACDRFWAGRISAGRFAELFGGEKGSEASCEETAAGGPRCGTTREQRCQMRSPEAGQPPLAGGDRNQDGALCAVIPSVCRAGPYAENAWTARYSGPPPTWRPNYSISNIIIMSIERTPNAKGTRR
jgi:hypothetical protein